MNEHTSNVNAIHIKYASSIKNELCEYSYMQKRVILTYILYIGYFYAKNVKRR